MTPKLAAPQSTGARREDVAASGAAPGAQLTPGGVLEVRGARVVYEPDGRDAAPTTAVADVDLTVRSGEIVALLGPSGCGKSSLLRAIAGIEPLAAGAIVWNGRDLSAVPVHKRGFGLMFQDGQLFPHRSVVRNVMYGLKGKLNRSAARAKALELLEVVGLTGYADRPVTTLSGGEKQRVALARSLAPEPAVLLLDEPLSALDRALRERLAVELRAALVATNTTAIFVTHDHDEAFTVADRVAIMQAGHILQFGTPDELWNTPASRAVAEFLGYEAFTTDDDGAVVALAPHALRVAGLQTAACGLGGSQSHESAARDGGALVWSGRVESTVFRKGVLDATVQVAGLGQVSVALPVSGPYALNSLVRLELDETKTVVVPVH